MGQPGQKWQCFQPIDELFAENQNKGDGKQIADNAQQQHIQPWQAKGSSYDYRAAQLNERDHGNDENGTISTDMLRQEGK